MWTLVLSIVLVDGGMSYEYIRIDTLERCVKDSEFYLTSFPEKYNVACIKETNQ